MGLLEITRAHENAFFELFDVLSLLLVQQSSSESTSMTTKADYLLRFWYFVFPYPHSEVPFAFLSFFKKKFFLKKTGIKVKISLSPKYGLVVFW